MIIPVRHLPSSLVIYSHPLHPRISQAVSEMIGMLDQIHAIPKNIKFTLISNRKYLENGSYDPSSCRIAISSQAPDPHFTFLHEYGHFLDNRVLHPLSREYASRYDDSFLDLLRHCYQSPPLTIIDDMITRRSPRLTPKDHSFLKEAYEPHEVFARLYVQWVCTKTKHFHLHQSFQRRLTTPIRFAGINCGFQWEPTIFDDIIPKMELLLKFKGLL